MVHWTSEREIKEGKGKGKGKEEKGSWIQLTFIVSNEAGSVSQVFITLHNLLVTIVVAFEIHSCRDWSESRVIRKIARTCSLLTCQNTTFCPKIPEVSRKKREWSWMILFGTESRFLHYFRSRVIRP